ncbi:MAG: RecX family transcriptional regulator [Sphingobium sp. 32-64-5]|nr:MAG: RecX family transcriptional regulator [Sphingobium sp. 32-64-5]
MTRFRKENRRSSLDSGALRDLALAYVGRFATSRARLARYLERKVTERGWGDEKGPDIAGLVSHFVELGYVDDGAYARMKGASMERRGLGARRIGAALRADGIGETERLDSEAQARRGAWAAAEIFARRKRIGPYAREAADRPLRDRQLAAFLRAGHSMDMARRWVDAAPGEAPEDELSERDGEGR